MAAWVSVSDWHGVGSPFSSDVNFVGAQNYVKILGGGGLDEQNFGTALRNNFYYVLFVVPLQTAVALGLAVLVNGRALRGRGFFRTAFYFPSVTSSVAITVLWLFLFSSTGAVNKILSWIGVNGPNWFNEPTGIFHIGAGNPPAFMANNTLLGSPGGSGTAGPSVAMSAFIMLAIFTTSGTFMLLFIAALQNLSAEVTEAAMIDGAGAWARFWRITLPQLRPTLFHRADPRIDRHLADLRSDLQPARRVPLRTRHSPRRTCRTRRRSPASSGALAQRSRSSSSGSS